MKAVFKKLFLIFSLITGMVLICFLVIEGIGFYKLSHIRSQLAKEADSDTSQNDLPIKDLESQNAKLVEKIKKLSPKGTYIVVDTAKNRLYLRKDDQVIRKAVVATGNGNVLTEPGGKKRSWTFDTPRGEFAVKTKLKGPVWVRPDWAFIEEGEDVPKKLADRIQEDVMGDYAMGFGNGFFIHGTIYTRYLGRNATHGCVRVGDDDLIAVNEASTLGTKIYIY
jgi:L,D-transpeptidase ErfK/SrfK